MNYINCLWCGTTVVKKNVDHKFCTTKCRKKSWRQDNNKPEYPTFIQSPANNILPNPKPRLEIKKEQFKRPVTHVYQKVEQITAVDKKEPVLRSNSTLNPKEQRVIDTVNEVFDNMIIKKRKEEKKKGFYSKKEIDKTIRKLESKRIKVIRRANKINGDIRREIRVLSKKVIKGYMTTRQAQMKIDKIRNRKVKELSKIISKCEWLLL